jgi:hypothetical protein
MTTRNKSFASVLLNETPGLRDSLADSDLYSKLRDGLKTVTIDGEKFYVAEGDVLLDEDELGLYALRQETLKRARELGDAQLVRPEGLVGITERGKIVRWRDGLILTYCVLKKTFQSEGQYQQVRDNMLAATQAWEKTCGIEFGYRSELDESDSVRPEGIIFPVRGIDAGGQFIAAAFFPNDPTYRWRVVIDPSYFTTSFDKVGVLRHELGHVLGFRHEHIRSGAPPACPDETVWGTIDLTNYDPQSVMHYFCGGVGTRELRITELDRSGSQRVYGPPLDEFVFIG